MDHLEHIYRAWVAVEGGQGLPQLSVPTYAKPSKTKVGGNQITLELNPCPERGAILQGKRFEATQNAFIGMFEAIAGQGLSPLRPSGSGYSLDASDLETATIVAYSMPKTKGDQRITANQVQIGSGPNSIELIPDTGKGAKVRCSRDLNGQAIRVRVQYGNAIALTKDPVGTLEANLVARAKDQSIVFVWVPGCQMEAISRTLSLSFDPSRVREQVLVQ